MSTDTRTTMREVCHEKGNRLLELQQQIADEAAQETIALECKSIEMDSGTWWEPVGAVSGSLRNALEYLHLRGLIEYDGKLVRFVEGGK